LTLASSIDAYITNELGSIKLAKVGAPKKIRDALTGTFILNEHEINVLDLPIVQRLRRISQTALACLTYPCASHNRFQHTLGVTNIVTKLFNAFLSKKEYSKLVNEDDLRELRLAAILHDVGHGPFSHACEEIYGQMKEVQNERKKPEFEHVQSKPHEIMSYYVVKSKAFVELITKINSIYSLNLDAERMANMIIGNMNNPKRQGYISDFLNGPFDADKLDYMPRDAYFTGLKMDVDFDRIAYTCLVDQRPGKPRRLCSDISGAHNLEQILFNKVLLYSSMYNHHKVRAAVCMIKSIFEIIDDNNLTIRNRSFKEPVDFLAIDDYDVLSSFREAPLLKDTIDNIRNRQLLKRALVISRHTVENRNLTGKVTKLTGNPAQIKYLRTLIADEANKRGLSLPLYDIWLDLPRAPSLNEPTLCKVRITEEDYVDLSEVFPVDWWLTAYNETKWKGFVFCPPDKKIREIVYDAAEKVLKDVEGLRFNPMAKKEAKME